jgi:hypothetical protein
MNKRLKCTASRVGSQLLTASQPATALPLCPAAIAQPLHTAQPMSTLANGRHRKTPLASAVPLHLSLHHRKAAYCASATLRRCRCMFRWLFEHTLIGHLMLPAASNCEPHCSQLTVRRAFAHASRWTACACFTGAWHIDWTPQPAVDIGTLHRCPPRCRPDKMHVQ